ncbi:SDR family oxidoreductase [Candidatus Sumerlaeota bacterium]|nr:SDR family oxidoreductase [Candidatus Sumerlaeota bacterium]
MSTAESQPLKGRVALVTGAAGSVGRATALALAEAGADIAVADIRAEENQAVAGEIEAVGRQSTALPTDITDSAHADAAVALTVKHLGRLDILVNAAGTCPVHTALECPDDVWREVVAVNLDGVFWCCRAAGREMIERGEGGRIITLASMTAQVADEPLTHPAYAAAKAGVVMLTRYLAVDWGQHGITVNAISPGTAEPLMTPELADWRDHWIRQTPTGRLAEPGEIAQAVVFLASDAAAHISGHNLLIDGGYSCR